MRKFKLTLIVVAVSLAILLTLALFVEFDAPGLGQRILDSAGESAGIELQADGFRFNMRRGIVLDTVVATTQFPGGTVVTTLDRVVLEHRLLPLLLGDVVVDRLLLENPIIKVINDDASTASRAAARTAPPVARVWRVVRAQDEPSVTTVGRAVTVHSASVVNGTLLLSTAGSEPTTRVYGLDVELADIVVDPRASSVAVGLSGRGHIDVGEVHAAERIARGNRARLAADNGVFTVTGLELTAPEGSLGVTELVVDLTPDPYTYRMSLAGADIDLNGFLGIEESDALGLLSIEMDAAGAGPETGNVVGHGRIHLAEGRIPDLPALDQVTELLGLHVAGLRYEATIIDFTIGGNRVEVPPFEILSDGVHLQASGELAIDGAVDARTRVSVPRQDINLGDWQGDVADGLVEALTDENGWVSIPLLISGTVDELQVRLDSVAVLAALQEAAGGSLGNWLRGIIKRN
jgi:hypothetical protein